VKYLLRQLHAGLFKVTEENEPNHSAVLMKKSESEEIFLIERKPHYARGNDRHVYNCPDKLSSLKNNNLYLSNNRTFLQPSMNLQDSHLWKYILKFIV
jgi:hypothetical protein